MALATMLLTLLFLLSAACSTSTTIEHSAEMLDLHHQLIFPTDILLSNTGGRRQRTLSSTCSEDAFLWNIYDTNSTHVGFAVGTLHLPREIVTSGKAWMSIKNALDDCCAVYGELNIVDTSTFQEEAQDCLAQISTVSIAAIPDSELLMRYEDRLQEICMDMFPKNALAQRVWCEAFKQLGFSGVVGLVGAYNTPEYWDAYSSALKQGKALVSLDETILQEGRPAAALEDFETQCDAVLIPSNPSQDVFLENYDTIWGPYLEEGLNSSMSELIQLYKCGDLSGIEEVLRIGFEDGIEITEGYHAGLLDERNIVIAKNIVKALKEDSSRKLFAVGLAHWTYGDQSLEKLLEAEGYRLERVAGLYESTTYEDLSDSFCSSAIALGSNMLQGAALLFFSFWLA